MKKLSEELQKQEKVDPISNDARLAAETKVRSLEQSIAEIYPLRDEVTRLEERLVHLKKMRDSSGNRVRQAQHEEQRLHNRVQAALYQDTAQEVQEFKRAEANLDQLKQKHDELLNELENIKADSAHRRREIPGLEQYLTAKEKEKTKLATELKEKSEELAGLRLLLPQDQLDQIDEEMGKNRNLVLDTIEEKLRDVEERLEDLGPVKVHEEEKRKMENRRLVKATAEAKLAEAKTRLSNKEGPLQSKFDEFITWLKNAVKRANGILKRFAAQLGWAVKLQLRGLESAHTLALDVCITMHDGKKKRAEYAELSGGERTGLFVLLAVVLDGKSPVRIIDEVAPGLDNRNLSRVLGILDKAAHHIELVPQLFVALPASRHYPLV